MGLNIMCGGGQKVLINDELGEAQEYDIITGVARGINAISWSNNDFCQAVSKGNKVYYFDNYRTGYYIFDGARMEFVTKSLSYATHQNTITVLDNVFYFLANNGKIYSFDEENVQFYCDPPTDVTLCQIITFNGKLYAIGYESSHYYFYLYQNGSWTRKVGVPSGSYGIVWYEVGATSLAIYDNKIYLMGGGTLGTIATFDGENYSAVVGEHSGTTGCSASVYDGKIHLLGGNSYNTNPEILMNTNREIVFDGENWRWGERFNLNGEQNVRSEFLHKTSLAKIGNKEYIIGINGQFCVEKASDIYTGAYITR